MENAKLLRKWIIGGTVILSVTIGLWFAPSDIFGIQDLTCAQQRIIALFAFAALMWIVELVPNWVTSLLTIVLLLLAVTPVVPARALMASFADPVIMLFLGGFVLAIVASKYGMDTTLARVLLRPFGKKPHWVLLGVLIVIAVFSMFMSNTATAAMFLTFLAPVFASLPSGDKGKIGLAMAIPVAANIGGIGTPIGTPPNATAIGVMAQHGINVGFSDWAVRMIPFVLVMILISWGILLLFFPFKEKEVTLKIETKTIQERPWRKMVAWAGFGITIVLWMSEQWTGLSASVVALLPLALYTATGVFTEEDIRRIDWSVLWLVAGGFALGTALDQTGLARAFVESVDFSNMQIFLIVVVSAGICYLLSNFISNSATAALLIPIVIVIGEGIMGSPLADQFDRMGGQYTLNVFVAMAASLAMILPISTPPNALASSTRLVRTSDMAKIGIILGFIGLILGYFWLTAVFPFA